MVNRRKRPFRQTVRILGILTVWFLLACGCGKGTDDTEQSKQSQNSEIQSDIVLYLGDAAVSREEYAMLAREYCSQITMKYSTGQVNSENFWEEEVDGNIPYEELEELVREELKYNYALKELAVELGLTDEYEYEDLLSSMEKRNTSPENNKEDTAYGLSSFDETSYYKYWYSDLETQVQNELIKEQTDVSQEECRDYYDENQEAFSYETGVSVLYVEIPYDSEEQKQSVWATAMSLERAMESGAGEKEMREAFEDADFENLELNTLNTQEGMSGVYAKRWEIASQLTEGDVYGPYEDNAAVCVMKCTGRTKNGTIDFESSKAQIERYLRTQKAQELIAQKEEAMEVKNGKIGEKEVILGAVQ